MDNITLELNPYISEKNLLSNKFTKVGRVYEKRKILYSYYGKEGRRYPLAFLVITVDLEEKDLRYTIIDQNDKICHEVFRDDLIERNDFVKEVRDKFLKELYFLQKDGVAICPTEDILDMSRIEEKTNWNLLEQNFQSGDSILVRIKTKTGEMKNIPCKLKCFDLQEKKIEVNTKTSMLKINFETISKIILKNPA